MGVSLRTWQKHVHLFNTKPSTKLRTNEEKKKSGNEWRRIKICMWLNADEKKYRHDTTVPTSHHLRCITRFCLNMNAKWRVNLRNAYRSDTWETVLQWYHMLIVFNGPFFYFIESIARHLFTVYVINNIFFMYFTNFCYYIRKSAVSVVRTIFPLGTIFRIQASKIFKPIFLLPGSFSLAFVSVRAFFLIISIFAISLNADLELHLLQVISNIPHSKQFICMNHEFIWT